MISLELLDSPELAPLELPPFKAGVPEEVVAEAASTTWLVVNTRLIVLLPLMETMVVTNACVILPVWLLKLLVDPSWDETAPVSESIECGADCTWLREAEEPSSEVRVNEASVDAAFCVAVPICPNVEAGTDIIS